VPNRFGVPHIVLAISTRRTGSPPSNVAGRRIVAYSRLLSFSLSSRSLCDFLIGGAEADRELSSWPPWLIMNYFIYLALRQPSLRQRTTAVRRNYVLFRLAGILVLSYFKSDLVDPGHKISLGDPYVCNLSVEATIPNLL
jgi:hypothetical protein